MGVFYIENHFGRVKWAKGAFSSLSANNKNEWASENITVTQGSLLGQSPFISLALPVFQIYQVFFICLCFFFFNGRFFVLFWSCLTLVRFCSWPCLLKSHFSEQHFHFSHCRNHVLPTFVWPFLSVRTGWYCTVRPGWSGMQLFYDGDILLHI